MSTTFKERRCELLDDQDLGKLIASLEDGVLKDSKQNTTSRFGSYLLSARAEHWVDLRAPS